MSVVQNVISGKNLSNAWAKALVKSHLAPGGVLAPAMIEFPAPTDGELLEDEDIRVIVDKHLAGLANPEKIETVAGTIFPYSIWRWARGDRHKFFDAYYASIPRILRCKGTAMGSILPGWSPFLARMDRQKTSWSKS